MFLPITYLDSSVASFSKGDGRGCSAGLWEALLRGRSVSVALPFATDVDILMVQLFFRNRDDDFAQL